MKDRNPNLYEKKKKICSFFIIFSLIVFMGLMVVEVYAIKEFKKNFFIIVAIAAVAVLCVVIAIVEMLRLIKLYKDEDALVNEEIFKALKNMQILQSENFNRFNSDIERVIQHNKEILDESVEDIFKVQKEVSIAIVKKNESSAQKTIEQNKENAEAIIAANLDMKDDVNLIKNELMKFYDYSKEFRTEIKDKIDSIKESADKSIELNEDIENVMQEKTNSENENNLKFENMKNEILLALAEKNLDFPTDEFLTIEKNINDLQKMQNELVTKNDKEELLEKIIEFFEQTKNNFNEAKTDNVINEKIDNLKLEVEESVGQIASNFNSRVDNIIEKIGEINEKIEMFFEEDESDVDEIEAEDNAIAEEMLKLNSRISQQIESNFAEMEEVIARQAEEIKSLTEKYDEILNKIKEIDDKTERFDAVIENNLTYKGESVEGLPLENLQGKDQIDNKISEVVTKIESELLPEPELETEQVEEQVPELEEPEINLEELIQPDEELVLESENKEIDPAIENEEEQNKEEVPTSEESTEILMESEIVPEIDTEQTPILETESMPENDTAEELNLEEEKKIDEEIESELLPGLELETEQVEEQIPELEEPEINLEELIQPEEELVLESENKEIDSAIENEEEQNQEERFSADEIALMFDDEVK